jgi:REP element-mobilizing transposase RayT
MKFNPEIHHRRSIRLKGYDYSRNGAYFVTICSWNRECIFGEISNRGTCFNEIGLIVDETWSWLGKQYPYLELMEHVIMPNHFHGLIIIDNWKGGSRTAPTEKSKPLGRLLGAFKTRSTKLINVSRRTPGAPVWQRNYYERIVRNESEFKRISEYIINNPANWRDDENNPINVGFKEQLF